MKIDQIHAALLQQGFRIETAKAITNSLFHDIETDEYGDTNLMYVRARVERLEKALNTIKKQTYNIKVDEPQDDEPINGGALTWTQDAS